MKRIFNLLIFLPVISFLSGCGNNPPLGQKVTRLADFIYEVDTYHNLDFDYADSYFYHENYNWDGGGCSAITKMIDNHRIIGRNMDLNISNNCAYIVRTDITDKHKTVGLQYTFRDISPKYEEVKAHGISEEWSKLIPFFQDDVMNELGFHIELNMRHAEFWPNGDDMFACWGTNPNAERTIHMFELPMYLALNCATIEDAKEFVKSLNIYSKKGYWNYSYLLGDASGDAAILEFATNEIHWIDEEMVEDGMLDYLNTEKNNMALNYHALAQTNFYLSFVPYICQNTKSGLGRMKTLQDGIDLVDSKQKMFALMDKIAYSNFYLPYKECKNEHFDPRSEQIGEFTGATLDVIMDDELEPWIEMIMDAYSAPIREMSREQKAEKNEYWESTFTEVVDCMEQSIQVRMFENNDLIYRITLNKTEKILTIN